MLDILNFYLNTAKKEDQNCLNKKIEPDIMTTKENNIIQELYMIFKQTNSKFFLKITEILKIIMIALTKNQQYEIVNIEL